MKNTGFKYGEYDTEPRAAFLYCSACKKKDEEIDRLQTEIKLLEASESASFEQIKQQDEEIEKLKIAIKEAIVNEGPFTATGDRIKWWRPLIDFVGDHEA